MPQVAFLPIPDPPNILTLPWYGAERALPPYRFLPRLHPHPIRDPKGHSYRVVRAQVHPSWAPERWRTLQAYLHGADLFNRFYFWEAHEAWEALWKSHPPTSDPALFIQGLINIAASFLKLHMQAPSAARNLFRAAAGQLDRFKEEPWMGLDVGRFVAATENYLRPLEQGSLPTLGEATPSIYLN